MREFILLASKSKTSSDFSLDNLPEAGRMDLVCRTISNALWISNDLRKDTAIHVAMNGPPCPPKMISFFGENLSGILPDERSIGLAVKTTLKAGMDLKLEEKKEAFPGIAVAKKSFESLIKEKSKTSQLVYLHPKGKDLREFKFEKDVCFVLGDFIGLPPKTEKLLDRLGAERISLGPVVVFASHCPILVHNEMDRRG
ncbi:MAG: tRNA (pseudouridine(54)-N(1))-methyltransferase TrmY [Candidatus Woesearchaeota archaeon]